MKNPFELKQAIENKSAKVVVWGCGLLGTTNLVYLSNTGYNVLGIDINANRISQINDGELGMASDQGELSEFFELKNNQKVSVTTNFNEALNGEWNIHIICVPTEKNGKPYKLPFEDVIKKINSIKRTSPLLIIIESTIVPEWINELHDGIKKYGRTIGEDTFIGAAPRRDLFGDPNFSLKNTNRVIGGSCSYSETLLQSFYGKFCKFLVLAKDSQHSMMSKIIENMFRYQAITFTNQLMLSMNDYDTKHILELSGSKWNMETYHPSLGVGGYCIPLAHQYFIEEMQVKNSTIPELIKTASVFNQVYTPMIFNNLKGIFKNVKNVAILGVSYIANIKVPIGSITKEWVYELKNNGISVSIHDPLMSRNELDSYIPDCHIINDMNELKNYDALIVLTDHTFYKEIPDLTKLLNKDCFVIDNLGTWATILNDTNAKYYEVGTPLTLQGVGSFGDIKNKIY